MEKATEFQKNISFCFIDYTKAFDCVDHTKLWKSLKETGIPDHLTCLLRNLYSGQEAIVRGRYGTMDWFKIRKEICQGCIFSSCLFKLHAKYNMQNARLDEAQAEIKIVGRIINNLRYRGAAAAKLLQSCLTLCDPTDSSPPGSSDPEILQARIPECVAMPFSNAWKWKWSCSVVSNSSRPHGL